MKPVDITTAALVAVAMIATSSMAPVTAVHAQAPAAARDIAAEQRNLDIVRAAFDRWLAGGGFFDQLPAAGSRWTVHGSGPLAKTYEGREGYIAGFVRAFAARLEAPVKPTVRQLIAPASALNSA